MQLQQWLSAYSASVGPSAALCQTILERLLNGALEAQEGQKQLLELLGILEILSPDPRTVCCTMLFVGQQHGEDLDKWKQDLPQVVWKQLCG